MNHFFEIIVKDQFHQFAIILLLAALAGMAGQLLKQPLIVVFIAVGIIVGPSFLNIAHAKENISLLSEIGISILLFIVGLKLDLRLIKSTGKISLITGLGQVFFTAGIGYLIAILMGLSSLHSFYISVALTFSSTIIIVKLLSDKREINSLHGQIAIGFLIVQDIVVILVMIIISAMGEREESSLSSELFKTLITGLLLFGIVLVFMKWIIPPLSYFLAKSSELLLLFSIAWAISLASISEIIDFSPEVGAFLAGISLASTKFKENISSRLTSLRDFLLLFFFVNLGMTLNLSEIGSQVLSAILFSVFVLVGNPLIVLIIMGFLGYRKRTAFLAGLTVAQISEFSLIFAGLGMQMGHIDQDTVGLITLVGLITIGLSTYMILYGENLYNVLSPFLSVFEKQDPHKESKIKLNENRSFDVIIFGMGRFGKNIARYLEVHNITFMCVDFDPQLVKTAQEKGESVVYGDLLDPDILHELPFHHAKAILSTIPDFNHNIKLSRTLKQEKYKGKVFITLRQEKNLDIMRDQSEDNVILMPYQMAAENFYYSHLVPLFPDKTKGRFRL